MSAIALREPETKGSDIDLAGRRASVQLLAGIRQDEAALGDPDAPVRIGYFTDVQCRLCGRYHRRVLPDLVRKLVRPGKAVIELRHFSTSARERTIGAIAAVAAAQQRREWQFADLFMRNQSRVPRSGIDDGFLKNIARAAGLDVRSWEDRRDSDAVSERLDADAKEARDLRLPAEPAMIVEGPRGYRKLVSAPSATRIARTVRQVGPG